MYFRRFIALGVIFTALTVGFALPAFAATVSIVDTYVLPAGSTVEQNLYAAAGTALVSGTLRGDAVIASGDVTVSGPVGGSLLVAGGTSDILGPVSGSVRAVGGRLTVTDAVGGDLAAAGGAVSLSSSGTIGGDALLGAAQVTLLGSVAKDAYIAGRDVFIDGKIGGTLHVYATNSVHLGPHASIGGDFFYHTPSPAVIDAGARIGGKASFEYLAPILVARNVRGFFAGLFGLALIVRLLVLIASALFFVLVFRRVSTSLVRVSTGSFWKTVLIGLAVFAAAPLGSLIVLITVFGGLLSAIALIVWLLMAALSQIYAGVVLAAAFRKFGQKRELPPVIPWQDAVLGVIALNIVCLVPYVGIFVYAIFSLSAMGAISHLAYRHFLLSRR